MFESNDLKRMLEFNKIYLKNKYIQWSNENMFNNYIKDNEEMFGGKFVAISFNELPGVQDFSTLYDRHKKYTFEHIQAGCKFIIDTNSMRKVDIVYCPICQRKLKQKLKCSLGSSLVRQILDEEGVYYETEVNDVGAHPMLRYDFKVCVGNNIGYIEYDGSNHIRYDDVIERDNIKNSECIKRGTPLLRIPHMFFIQERIRSLIKPFLRYLKDYNKDCLNNCTVIEDVYRPQIPIRQYIVM